MPFGHDLGSDENIHTLFLDVFQHLLPRILAPRTVTIDPHDACIGKTFFQRGCHSLRTVPKRGDILISALGAGIGVVFRWPQWWQHICSRAGIPRVGWRSGGKSQSIRTICTVILAHSRAGL